MDKVPAYVHPSHIVPDVLTMRHEHRSGLILSVDHETCHMLPDMSDNLIHTSLLQEVDDMTIGLLEEPPSSPTQYTNYSVAGPVEKRAPVPPYLGGRGRVDPKHGGEREGGGSDGRGRADPGSYVLLDLFDSLALDASTFSLDLTLVAPSHPSRAGTSYIPPYLFDSLDTDYVQPPPSTGGMSYAPPPLSAVGLSFDLPPPSGKVASFVPRMPISCASSSDSEHGDEPANDVTPV
ncbi:hypothetical protein M9H77_22601 [Catharanthus roseus]|uniref:Uncharacterized protein n=1 Tax=Catharanthus roseus TaxID=4058 RepID=A0ACC0AV13_CATRO|nr:hypothetical protein M9H77_22601 [Catharanthus roseus]